MSTRQRGYALATFVFLLIASAGSYLFWPEDPLAAPSLRSLSASAEQGQYLARVGNCQTCHTTQHGEPFAGGVRFESDFGTLYSTNITADETTGLGRWTFENFYRAMKTGVRPDGTQLYPAFPFPSFAKLTDEDIASLYLFMKTVTPVRATQPQNDLDFPYNLRWGMRAWNKLFHEPATYQASATQSAEWNRGAYLVQGAAHCGACHTPRNALGAERNDAFLAGGSIYDEVSPGKYRRWSAVNLTPAKSGLASWSTENIVAYLKEGESEHAVVHGPMAEVIVNSTHHLKDQDARAIATYLKTIPAIESGRQRPPSVEQLAAGEITYTVHCGTCHLPTGLGDEVMGVALAGNAIVQSADAASLLNVILYGPHLPPPPFVSDRTRMKPFGKRLSDEDIANLATYVRASFGNQAARVTADQVSRQR